MCTVLCWQHSTPLLGNINSSCLLLAVMKSPEQEIIFMEDYLKDMWPIYSSRYSRFYPWIKPDHQRAAHLDQMVLAPCGSRFTDLCLGILFWVHTEGMLDRKAQGLAITFKGRMVFFELPVSFYAPFWSPTWETSLSFSFSRETGIILTNGQCKNLSVMASLWSLVTGKFRF